ncbi:MAG: CheR family methyltransferase, partial [Clostridium sp.]|nr:CheR family methyltransferase [Clostridium sp.]
CSIGCEPYSLAIMLDKLSVKNNVKIIATDIDRNALAKAEKGVYTLDEIKNVKKEDLDKYFEKIDDNYCVSKNIKSMVTFRKHDLITEKYEGGFDLIVCRNVVIYFKSDAKMEVYSKLAGALNKGGFLFVGGTESIYDYKKVGLERVSTFIYKKL